MLALVLASDPTTRNIRQSELRAIVVDRFAPRGDPRLLATLEARCPRREVPSAYPDSFRAVGRELSLQWNVPPDENYARHGVLVHRGDPRDPSLHWVARRVSVLLGKQLEVSEVQYKTHLDRSNGVWLHTDRRAGRQILVLLYLDTLAAHDGGELVLFRKARRPQPNATQVSGYVSGRPIDGFGAAVETAGVGGEWTHGNATLVPARRVRPRRNRAVVLDHRESANVHAVTRMRSAAPRRLVEIWLTRSAPPI